MSKRAWLNVWFGNFYRPAYDDEAFVEKTMEQIADLGFDSVMLDTKAWEDVKERCEGGEASQYMKMQEFMMDSARRNGLTHTFLALYLNGDNLYPRIRFSPPIFGEEVINRQGKPGRWYKYWSPAAQKSMVDHVERLLQTYGENMASISVEGRERHPLCSMWDPMVAMSFEEEGRERYADFLKRKYGTIEAFNRAYGVEKKDFSELTLEECWFGFHYDGSDPISETDIREQTRRFRLWQDNAQWRMEELTAYFCRMEERLKTVKEDLYLFPGISQWGYFLNIDGSRLTDQDADFCDLWDTAVRGVDIYGLAPHVDCCHFLTVPVTPDGTPDAYVSAYQHSMMRALNKGRPFLGGIYWGRFLYQDLYRYLTPCEIIGTMTAAGADGYSCYGINGMDDGGILNCLDDSFQESLKKGNRWCRRVTEKRVGRRKKTAALLFPSAMAGIEPFRTEGNKVRRLDSLGWYRILSDLGLAVDVIDYREIEAGGLSDYQVLILPADDCYETDRKPEAEQELRSWVEAGGTLIHGPADGYAKHAFGIEGTAHGKEPWIFDRPIIPQGLSFESIEGDRTLAVYLDSKKPCVAERTFGCGRVISFGVQAGAAYASQNIPHVPYEQKNGEMYPLALSKTKLFEALFSEIVKEGLRPWAGKDLEIGEFENGMIVVNHRSTPWEIPEEERKRAAGCDFQYPVDGKTLLPHTAVWIQKNM